MTISILHVATSYQWYSLLYQTPLHNTSKTVTTSGTVKARSYNREYNRYRIRWLIPCCCFATTTVTVTFSVSRTYFSHRKHSKILALSFPSQQHARSMTLWRERGTYVQSVPSVRAWSKVVSTVKTNSRFFHKYKPSPPRQLFNMRHVR